MPQWLHRETDYSQQKNACYWNYVRVYLPPGSRMLSSTELPLPEWSVSVEIGMGVPGQETGSITSSHNKTVFAGLTSLEAGARREIDLVYDLPESVLRREGNRLGYKLLLQKQPGVRDRLASVELRVPEGYRLAGSSVAPVEDSRSVVRFLISIERDSILDVEFINDVDS